MCCFSYDSEYIENPEQKCGFCEFLTFVYALIEYFIPISLVSVLLWVLLRPDNLRPRVDAAVVVSFSLDNATSSLDYDIAMDLSFHNQHRYLDVRYLDLIAVASYGGTRLGPSVDVLPIFVQRPMASNVVHATFQGSATPLAPAAAELFNRESTNGSFNVLVTVASTFMYKFPFKKTVYYFDHECYIRFPKSNSGVTPPATVLTPGTLCSATAR
ncbi:NDR1/HIN1-like protein 26 [Miscanthus floridulus]|uniref:NDR1/HIN1-like protein 26 n=1 Tax=Miscanthus floridulus TaxID=154761 RepID=UPI00345B43ED